MSKQDRQGARTPSDLERKYNFGRFMNDSRNLSLQIELQIKQLNQNVTQLNTELLAKIEDLKNEIVKHNQTWFFSGKPTLENAPAAEWNTDDIKMSHVGDLYFDNDDGRVYLFKSTEGSYEWVSCHTGEDNAGLLECTVTFTAEGTIYEIVSVKKGNSVNAPLTNPTSEIGDFVSWQIDGVDVVFPYAPSGDTEITAFFSAST